MGCTTYGDPVRKERAQITATAAAEISDYERHNTLDSVDQQYGLVVDLSPSTLWQVGFSGEYVDDYTFVSALEESGIPAERSRRKRATVSPHAIVALDEKNSLQFDYSFTKTQYDLSAYSDYRTHGGSLGWYHRLSNERTRLIFSVGASRADFDRTDHDVVQKTYRGLVGVEHEFTETLSATFLAGARYTKSEFPRAGAVVEEEDTGMVLDGSLRWRFEERLTLSADVDRDIAQSIYGENMIRDRVRVGLGIRLTERLRGNLTAAYYRNKTEGFIQAEKRQTYRLGPAVSWRLGEKWSLWGGYSYTWTENQINNRSQERNRVYVQLAFDWPIVLD
ncbi:MAG: outer membrane beta-barrel protein [Deltaproteobacteria bacterium]|nr:outer membrane beta-barrel protein [Deltaproteobacteria bacterium]